MVDNLKIEENLLFIEKCLKEFEYPNIYGTDLGEILGGPNRLFLLSWLYNLIMDKEGSNEQTVEVLSEFLNCFGFCPSSQTQKFLAMNLDYPIQLQILIRMFKMLKTLKKKKTDSDNLDEISIEKIQDFIQTDVNIFRSCGILKTSQYVPEEVDNEPSAFMKSTSEKSEQIERLSLIENKIDHAAHIISNSSKSTCTNELEINLDDYSIDKVNEFNENIAKAQEVIKNIQILSSLKDGIMFDQVVIPDEKENDYTVAAKEIVKLISEI